MSKDPVLDWEQDLVPLVNSLKLLTPKQLYEPLFKLNSIVKAANLDTKVYDSILLSVLHSQYTKSTQDAKYHKSLLTIFDSYLTLDCDKYAKSIIAFISKNSTSPLATQDLINLIQWNSHILSETRANEEVFQSVLKVALKSSCELFSNLLDDHNQSQTKHHQRASAAGRVYLIDAFVSILKAPSETIKVKSLIDVILDSKLSISGSLAHLGFISEACLRLAQDKKHQTPFSDLCALENSICQFFAKDSLSTKVFPSEMSLNEFGIFVGKVMSFESFTKLIIPGLEKSALRNSELTFAIFTPSLLSNCGFDILTPLMKSSLFTKLITSLKATKENVKFGASKCLQIILNKSNEETDESAVLKVLEEVFKIFKTIPANSFDQKIMMANIIAECPVANFKISSKICEDLLPIAQKDANELSLKSSLDLLFKRYIYGLVNDNHVNNEKAILESLSKGLNDKKLKAVWSMALSSALLSHDFSSNDKAIEKISSILIDGGFADLLYRNFEECIKAPLPSVSNKLIGGGYASLAILIHLKNHLKNDIINAKIDQFNLIKLASPVDDTEISCFTNLKVLLKLQSTDDQIWFVRALYTIGCGLKEVNAQFGLACILASLSRNFDYRARLLANSLLKNCVTQNELIVTKSIVDAIREFTLNSSEEDLNLDYNYLPPFIYSLLTNGQSRANIESNLIQLLLPAHHQSFQNVFKLGWIGICQRVGLDPGAVVSANAQLIIDELSDVFVLSEKSESIKKAICDVIGTTSFVSPNTIVPLLIEVVKSDLAIVKDIEIDESRMLIWRAKEGDLVHDVLQTDSSKNISTKGKDAETLKWEQSVRKELEAKNKTTRKLTKEEQAKVNEQLASESAIRAKIQSQYLTLSRALSIIISLAHKSRDVENGKDVWFPVSIDQLLSLLSNNDVLKMCDKLVCDCYLAMSLAVQNSSLSGTSNMEFIGASTLRLYNVQCIPGEFTGKQLNDILSSQLFSLKLASDKSQFNKLILMYVLPLLVKIIENGKIFTMKNSKKIVKVKSEFNDEAPEEEQLILALEIIASNGDLFEDATIPRNAILSNLIDLLALPTKAKIAKDCFVTLCQNIALNIYENELSILLKNLVNPVSFVRSTILEVLDDEFDLSGHNFNEELWIARFDNESSNAELAQTIWQESNFQLDSNSPSTLIRFLGLEDNGVRLSVGKAFASNIISLNDETLFMEMLDKLLDHYREMTLPPVPKTDEFGIVIKSKDEKLDRWEERSGVSLALRYLAPMFKPSESIEKFFKFAVNERALGDKDSIVRSEIQDAGMHIIDAHGKSNVPTLIEIFEAALEEPDEKSKIQDNVKESTIILYGNLARHLDMGDSRIEDIVSRLLKALDTPSEDVQYAVSECIAPLVQFVSHNLNEYFDSLFEKLFQGASIAERRGAAYGIAGLVKGYGIRALSEYDIIRNLTDASDDNKDFKKREGVSFALECLSQSLGALFEPYILEILPILLKSFGDQSNEVREATTYAAKIFMKNTTSYGIKKMIPIAIANLEDYQWRAKKGSVELLGSMAYLDPTQLSSSLPEIVPNIVQVLKDTHKEVRKAADSSLKKFGEVIRNPEIQSIVEDLLNAIGDPTKYTDIALEKLIRTQFAHYIDGPSLALIIHVIDRGMQDRSSIVKKKASQIIGNMAILVDSRDIMPYLAKLVEELQTAIVDPVDETRAIASRALGSLVEKLGEEKFPGLIDNLLATLSDEERASDRLGSAQALSEVLFGLGLSKLEDLLPSILQGANSSKSFVREGYMPMLLYLPVCFGSQFSPYLNQTIPPILNGLADTNEDVRQISMKAGRLIVSNYAKKAVDLLLPELEKGLFDISPRIRQSSADLTGELLYKISGISGKMELAEDIARAANVSQSLIDVLGLEKRNQVLSALFVCRSDTHGTVRNAAGDVWKALVANTPRTIKEILPTLTVIIVRRLASSNDEQRTIAAATLGDMVRRIGSNALSQLLPTLEESMIGSDSDAKQGICIAIKELIESSSEDNVIEYQETFVKIIKDALVDANPEVRESAANAFDIFQTKIGSDAVDEIIPQLLEQLNTGSDEALDALKEIMSTKSDVIFPILLPSLLASPINANAIGSLAEVAGSALYKRLGSIINALVEGIINQSGNIEEIKQALVKTIVSVDSDAGVHPLMQQLLSLMKHEDSQKRQIIYQALPEFFQKTTLDYSVYTEDILIQGIYNLNNKDTQLASNAFEMLTILVKSQRKETLERLIKVTQQTLSHVSQDCEEIYAFTLPRGPNCLLPIFIHGLMYGTPEQREVSSNGITIIIEKTPAIGLKPFVTGIVGPLIRVIGERFNGDVKAAILLSLNKLFEKIPQLLRPFIPQLQRTFIKCLTDGSSSLLRSRSAKAIGTLIEYQPKVDPLVIELLNNFKNVDDNTVSNAGEIKSAILKAILEIIEKAGSKISENCKNGIMELIEREMGSNVNVVVYAELIGSISRILDEEEFQNMINNKILSNDDENTAEFSILILNSFLKFSGAKVITLGVNEEILEYLIKMSDDEVYPITVSSNAVLAMGKMMLLCSDESLIESLSEQLGHIIVSGKSTDVRRLGLTIVRAISNENYMPCMLKLVPMVFTCVRDTVLPIKLASEKALLSLLNLVESNERFDEWVNTQEGVEEYDVEGKKILKRSITEYVKRIGSRLANQERERLSAGGDKEAMYSDLYEEKAEIWSVSV